VAEVIEEMKALLGERAACAQLGFPRGSFQRRPIPTADNTEQADNPGEHGICSRPQRRYQKRHRLKVARQAAARALNAVQRQELLDVVHETRFINRSVPYIYATLLDEGRYYGSISTMYRVLHTVGEVGERRDQATRPAHVKPELFADAPNQVYTWDITKLHGPQKWTYYYLYTIIDIHSRYVVGWLIADRESSELARELLSQTIKNQKADPLKLTIHADRGSSMKSKPVAFLLSDLGVTKTHSRPHVSNDNPYIESFFKTLKYQPEFPKTFLNIAEARYFCQEFFRWYNQEHRHSGIALLTPSDVHHGRAEERIAKRQVVLDAAYEAHPERFVHGRPKAMQLAPISYINKPNLDVPLAIAA
jgi:putative transposase